MRLLVFVMGFLVVTGMISTRADAQNYPWCLTSGGFGATNCGFSTFEQCLATRQGAGGFCNQNTQYQSGNATPVSRKHKSH